MRGEPTMQGMRAIPCVKQGQLERLMQATSLVCIGRQGRDLEGWYIQKRMLPGQVMAIATTSQGGDIASCEH